MSFFDAVFALAALALAWFAGVASSLWVIKRKAPTLYKAVSEALQEKKEGGT